MTEPQIRDLHRILTAGIDSLLHSTERELALVRSSEPMSNLWLAHMTTISTTTCIADALIEMRKALRAEP